MSNFDKLYDLLYGELTKRCACDINRFEFQYFDEMVCVEFRYSDKMMYVVHVKSLKGELDYAYAHQSMELYTWLLRQDSRKCEAELEKVLFNLIS